MVASASLPEPCPALLRRATFGCDAGVPARLPLPIIEDFFIFLRDDSFPLDSDNAGDPARFKDLVFLANSPGFCFPCGVIDPLEPVPLVLSFPSPCVSLSASFLSSSLFSSSPSSCSSSPLDPSSDYSSMLVRFDGILAIETQAYRTTPGVFLGVVAFIDILSISLNQSLLGALAIFLSLKFFSQLFL